MGRRNVYELLINISVLLQEQRSLKAGDLSHQESNNMAASTMKLQSDSFSSEKVRKDLAQRIVSS